MDNTSLTPPERAVVRGVRLAPTRSSSAVLEKLVAPSSAAAEVRREPRSLTTSRNVGDRIFSYLTSGFAGAVIGVLVLLFAILVLQSRVSIARFGFSFLTSSTWDPSHNLFGAAPAILGTVYTSLLALLLAAPIGLTVAIFLTELAPRLTRSSLGFFVELLAAIPSIVYGLWALFVLVPLVQQHLEPFFIGHFGNTALFSGYPIGLGFFTAAIILAIMILPTITAISRDVMQAVPDTQREAMLALGGTKWETAWKAVIPYARSGIIGAILLALGRAVGETMAVQMVIGSTTGAFNLSLFSTGTTLPAQIVNQFTEATGSVYISALIELALILLVITVILNAAARLLIWNVERERSGS